MTSRLRHFLFCCFTLFLLSPATAQPSLDPAMLIDELADQGMSDLLLHLIETEPSDDPIIDQQRKIAQLRLQYRNPSLSEADRQSAFDEAIAAQRQLIADHPDHEQRPIWQTDLAEMLLVDRLRTRERRAAAFYLYGVPTADQSEAVADVAPEALQLLADADLRFFQLEGLLPRDPDHVQRRVQTGLWDRMMEEYWRKRTRFFLGEAALLTALLPDDADYYRTLGRGGVPQQAGDPAAERRRLLALAAEKLQPVLRVADNETLRRDAAAMLGRSLAEAGSAGEAVDALRPLVAEPPSPTAGDLHVRLAEALSAGQAGRTSEAIAQLQRLRSHPRVEVDLLSRVLVADAQHRVLLTDVPATGPQRTAALSDAYAPYLALLEDPAVAAQREGLKNYIYERWASSLEPDADTAQLPEAVQMAVGEISRMRGQNLAIRAQRDKDDAAAAEAQPLLAQAVAVNRQLLAGNPSPAVAATARYNLGLAQYWLEPNQPANVLEAGQTLVTAAREAPAHPVSESAIAVGIDLLRRVASLDRPPQGAAEAYREAASVLFETFGTSRAADNERYYYALTVPAQEGDDAAVARLLADVPEGHATYFDAQIQRLAALARLAAAATGRERDRAADDLAAAAREVKAAAERAGHDAGEAAARLAEARVAALRNRIADALPILDELQADVANNPLLLTQVLETRIQTLVEADRLEDAARDARQMMQTSPDAGAATIDAVLTDLAGRIDALRSRAERELAPSVQQRLREEAQQLAKSAAVLAELLLDWAKGRGLGEGELAAYQLLHARTLRQAGDAGAAAAALRPLAEAYPNDPEVLSELAEAQFAVGDAASLREAARIYDRLIASHQPPYPDAWWNAWLKRLQIMQKQNADPQQIRLRVRQLRFTDPDLGGEPYRSQLESMLGE